MTTVRVSVLIATAVLFPAAYAHSMYQSDVMLDFEGDQVHAEIQLPVQRVGIAFGNPITSQSLDRYRTPLKEFVISRFHIRASDGQRFVTKVASPLTIKNVDGAPYVVAHITATPQPTSPRDIYEIEDDVLLDRIPSQVALVSIRSDWKSSVFASDPQLVGVLRGASRSVVIDRTQGSWIRGFRSVFELGMRHIAEGTDHLLFLLALLLPAPLLLFRSSWNGPTAVRQSLVRIVRVVTAFTVGHSTTLALATLDFVHVPSRPIEVLIAVSILVSAIHAVRPLFPGREAVIAASFGLIHGLAFATTLSELGLGRWERVASILGFNLGIETMQLSVVAAVLPSLLLLSRTAFYSLFRVGGACFAGLASCGWIIERTFDKQISVDVVVDSIAHHAVPLACILFLFSLSAWSFRRSGSGNEISLISNPQPSLERPS